MSEKTRTGRPLKEHAPGTQVVITLQVPAELKSALQARAINSNRTLSQEAQRRLERSFSMHALREDANTLAAEQTGPELMAEIERVTALMKQRTDELQRLVQQTQKPHAKRGRR